jgi:conjugal transfer pilus assembly protein TraK
MIKIFLTVLILLLPITSFGAQRVPVKDGVAAKITISANGLNHIAVEDDRIIAVKGSPSQFQLDKDEVLGHIYIQAEQNNNEPIQLFVSTEKQHTLSLLLVPGDVPAGSIMLTLEKEKKIAAVWEQSQPYEAVVTSLIKAMHNRESLEGYSVEEVNIKSRASNGLDIQHLRSYRGQSLRGEILQVSNNKKILIEIIENDFYKSGIRAVAISNKSISPNGKTIGYLVRENG